MLEALPSEVLWIVLTYFLNLQEERNPQDDTYVLDVDRCIVRNGRYDINGRQGLAIFWKLVCKAFHKLLHWHVQCPLIRLCDTYEMLDFVRDDWNPHHLDTKDTRLLDKATTYCNTKLQKKLLDALPTLREAEEARRAGPAEDPR